jgi:hypothetical protein
MLSRAPKPAGDSTGASLSDEPFQNGGQTMATLTARGRDRLRSNQFAYVDRDGGEHLPIHDEAHVRNAIARFNQVDFESAAARERARKKVLAAAERHGVEVSDDSNVARRGRSG